MNLVTIIAFKYEFEEERERPEEERKRAEEGAEEARGAVGQRDEQKVRINLHYFRIFPSKEGEKEWYTPPHH